MTYTESVEKAATEYAQNSDISIILKHFNSTKSQHDLNQFIWDVKFAADRK